MHHWLVRSDWCTNIYYSVPCVCSITLNQVFASYRISSVLCFLFEWWLYLGSNQYSVFSSVVQNIVYWFHLCCHNYLPISQPIRRNFFPKKCNLNSICVLCAKGKYYFQTYKYPYIYYTSSLSWDNENNHEDDFSGSDDDFLGFYDE